MHRRTFIRLFGLTGIAAAYSARPALAALSGARPEGSRRLDLTRYGFQRRSLDTPRGRMAIFEAGSGEPLLLLHGVGAGASSFLWFRLAPELATRYRVIAPDFVGWGDSERPARPLLFDDYVEQIEWLGRDVGQPTRVAAQSLTCGFTLAAMRDGLLDVARLVLHAPSGGQDFGLEAPGGAGARRAFSGPVDSPRLQEVYTRIFHQRPAVEDWYRRIGFLDGSTVPEELIEAGIRNARRENGAYSALPFLSGALRYDIAPLLRDVDVPTLMVWGESEIQIAPEVSRRIEAVNPAIETARIAGARSTFEIERPEETLEVLVPFLAG